MKGRLQNKGNQEQSCSQAGLELQFNDATNPVRVKQPQR